MELEALAISVVVRRALESIGALLHLVDFLIE
jgi:hypothetical protein